MKLKDEGVLKSWGANKKQQKRRKRRIRYTSLGFVLLWYPDSMGITIWDFSSSSAVSSLFLHWWYRWYRIISYVKLRFLFSVSSTKISFFNWVAFDENQKEKKERYTSFYISESWFFNRNRDGRVFREVGLGSQSWAVF